jgi:hypothetical protein
LPKLCREHNLPFEDTVVFIASKMSSYVTPPSAGSAAAFDG